MPANTPTTTMAKSIATAVHSCFLTCWMTRRSSILEPPCARDYHNCCECHADSTTPCHLSNRHWRETTDAVGGRHDQDPLARGDRRAFARHARCLRDGFHQQLGERQCRGRGWRGRWPGQR